jgi:hypothetical protein
MLSYISFLFCRKHRQASRDEHEGSGSIHFRIVDGSLLQLHVGSIRPPQIAEKNLLDQVVQRKPRVLQVRD